ncbi:MAG: hypothetical protein NEA02_17835 [Thermoanaerobaculia bacterium]|nr:hypothetical protein [Thermoanaerobaculia bacterium]
MNPNAEETRLADALIVAALAARRFERRRRLAGRALLAGSLLVAAVFGLRSAVRPVNIYVIQGDSTGVVLTGPGVARRIERASVPVPPKKGDRT